MADFATDQPAPKEGKLTGPWITAAYGAALGAGFVWLSVRVAWRRWKLETYVGDGGDLRLRRLARAHANFAENVPLSLVMLGFAEQLGAAPASIHGLCGLLVAARAVHAFGISRQPEPIWFRVVGFSANCFVLGAAAVLCVGAIVLGN